MSPYFIQSYGIKEEIQAITLRATGLKHVRRLDVVTNIQLEVLLSLTFHNL